MTVALRARGVEKRFGSVRAVRGLDLEVPEGACFGLIGENGAGKTTFIKMVLGITRPNAGELSVLGGSPHDVTLRRSIGYLPERLQIPESFSPLRFLASVGRAKQLTRPQIVDETRRVLELVALDPAAWRRATGGFSKGMRQRTGLAAALLGHPKLLVLDEPTDGIDPLGRAQIRDLIVAAVREGTTVFLNSHLLAETEKICDHVAVLSQGRVVIRGALDVLKRKDAFRVRFKKSDGDVEHAVAAGFVATDDLGDSRVFKLEGQSPEVLSAALAKALGAGLVVLEVMPELKDLETILKEAIVPSERGGA